MDITYIPMARGFVYLAVVLDWFSRRVLSWRLSITMEAAFCVETLEDAMAHHGKPEISIRTRARSSPARPSLACWPTAGDAFLDTLPPRRYKNAASPDEKSGKKLV